MDAKFFSIGIFLLAFGIILIYGYLAYPEVFLWVGIGGIAVLLSPFIAILLGLGLIYGSFSREEVPPPAPKSGFLIDERIDIEGAQRVAQETSICKQHLVPGEKLLGIILGEVEGKPELDRLALTDRGVFFCSTSKSRGVMKFDYGQVERVEGKKGKVLKHLGEINLFAKGESLRFKNILEENVEQIVNTISGRGEEIEGGEREGSGNKTHYSNQRRKGSAIIAATP